MHKKNRRLANLLLLIFAIGFLISYAFKDNFAAELISRCCMAALIGGLADWFGITAIFKKPFNMNWPEFLFRTDIINKNRNRIEETIIDTIEKELLSKEKIKDELKSYNLAGIIIRFIKSKEVDAALIKSIDEFFPYKDKIFKGENSLIYDFALNFLKNIKISPLLYKSFCWASIRGYDDIFIDKIIDSAVTISKKEDITEFLEKLYKDALKNYEKDNINRKITNKMILNYILDISPDSAAYSIQKKIVKTLNNMKSYDDKNRIILKDRLDTYILKFNNDTEFINRVENYKLEFLNKNNFLEEKINKILNDYIIENFYNNKYLIKSFKLQKRKLILKFLKDKEKVKEIDRTIKSILFNIIDDKYSYIGNLIRENLSKYNNEEIVKTMEHKLSEDLQIIRINGSIIGGLVGLFIFLLTFWIK